MVALSIVPGIVDSTVAVAGFVAWHHLLLLVWPRHLHQVNLLKNTSSLAEALAREPSVFNTGESNISNVWTVSRQQLPVTSTGVFECTQQAQVACDWPRASLTSLDALSNGKSNLCC